MPRGRKPKYPPETTICDLLIEHASAGRAGKSISPEMVEKALDKKFTITGNHTQRVGRKVRDVSIHDLDLPSRAMRPLVKMKIQNVEQLLAISRLEMLSQRRMGEISLVRVREELYDLLFPEYIGEGQIKKIGSFAEMVKRYVEQVIPDRRKSKLTLGRLAPTKERPQPLKSFGEQLDLSRERIRQIVDDALQRLRKPAKLMLLNSFWKEVWAVLESWQRPIQVSRLASGLERRLKWKTVPPAGALRRLFKLHPGLVLENGTVYLASRVQ